MTQHYVGTKVIQAYENEKDGKPGYAVQYPDGYTSWSPKDVFEEAYLPIGVIPAGTPDFVQRMIAERVQLNDRTAKLRAFYIEAERNDGHPDLQGDELEDVHSQLGWMVDYLEALDQRIQRHGFVIHDTGRLFTVKQAQVENRTHIEELIYPIIAGFERKGGLLDLHAARDIPKAICEKIYHSFDVSTDVECTFDNSYWTVKVSAKELFGGTTHEYKIRHLECYHRHTAALIGECLESAFRQVTEMGSANDVVFMSYLTDHFDRKKKLTELSEAAVMAEGKRVNGNWRFEVKYNDFFLTDEIFFYQVQRSCGAKSGYRFFSENSRQERFLRLCTYVQRMVPLAAEAIESKLDERLVDLTYTGPVLLVSRRLATLRYRDEALECLQQLVSAFEARAKEKN